MPALAVEDFTEGVELAAEFHPGHLLLDPLVGVVGVEPKISVSKFSRPGSFVSAVEISWLSEGLAKGKEDAPLKEDNDEEVKLEDVATSTVSPSVSITFVVGLLGILAQKCERGRCM